MNTAVFAQPVADDAEPGKTVDTIQNENLEP